MTIRRLLAVGVCGLLACGSATTAAPQPTTPTAPRPAPDPVPAPAPVPATEPAPDAPVAAPTENKQLDPIRERAGQLREAGNLLDKAAAARERDAKSYAEQLFSSAELIVGPDALADLASLFRQGAPPRVTTPPKAMPKDMAPQPIAIGNSEQEHPEPPKPKKGTLSGQVRIGGRDLAGEFAVVTVDQVGKKTLRALPTARVMEQRGRRFAPHVLVVPVGSVVAFPNFDPFFHNVFSTSDTKAFDLGLYRSGQAREIQFEKEGTVRVGCNLHANMMGYIVVVSEPHYVVTDDTGRFEFKSLSPGKYQLRAYSERARAPVTQTVDVKPGRNDLSIGMTADAPSGPLPDKFGVPRVSKNP